MIVVLHYTDELIHADSEHGALYERGVDEEAAVTIYWLILFHSLYSVVNFLVR